MFTSTTPAPLEEEASASFGRLKSRMWLLGEEKEFVDKAWRRGNIVPLLFLLKIGSRSSVYSPESSVRKTGSYIYEEFMPTDGTDVKVMVDAEI